MPNEEVQLDTDDAAVFFESLIFAVPFTLALWGMAVWLFIK